MLVKVSNQCAMACTHCLEDSRPGTGQHMSLDMFLATLDCIERVEQFATQIGYRFVLLSGGECTENPNIVEFIERIERAGRIPFLLTHGLWLDNSELRAAILKPGRNLLVQLTNDARYYPKRVPTYDPDPRILPTDQIGTLLPLGRAAGPGRIERLGTTSKQAPSSFNFRSFVHSFGDIRLAVLELRKIAMSGRGWGNCAPSISHDGTFVAGESRFCKPIGTVHDSVETLTRGVLQMGSCDRCTLERKLPATHRAAIGLAPLSA